MGYQFNPFTGNLDIVGDGGGGGGGGGDITAVTAGTGLSGGGTSGSVTLSLANTAVAAGSYTYGSFTVDAQGRITSASSGAAPVTAPAGSDTQIQVNDGGVFAGFIELLWNKITKVFTVKGDVRLDDGGTYTTTVQVVTPTANRTISYPDATGTLGLVAGSSGQLIYNNAGAYAGLSTFTTDSNGNITLTGRWTNSTANAASAPPVSITGSWTVSGGTATTYKPAFLLEPAGATSTGWSTSGTGLGVNAASGFAGNLLDLQVNGTSYFKILADGNIVTNTTAAGGFTFDKHNLFGAYYVPGGYHISSASSSAPFIKIGGAGTGSLQVRADSGYFGWGAEGQAGGTPTLVLIRDAANILAQRNSTNAQATRIYDTFTSATDYHRVTIATARATLTNVSGASVTATGLIPAGAVVMGVTSKVTTALGTGNGTTGYKVGTAADDDRWGAITGTAAGTTSDNRNWTAGTIECFPAATDVIVTATGGNFNATGVIYLSVQYMAGEAD